MHQLSPIVERGHFHLGGLAAPSFGWKWNPMGMILEMSKRIRLRKRLAEAIKTILSHSHEWTVPNCMRYVKPNLCSFQVGSETKVNLQDWESALEIATLTKARLVEQSQSLIECHSVATPLRDWRNHLLKRHDLLLSEGLLMKEEYDLRMRVMEQSITRSDFFIRLGIIASESGT